MAQNTFEGLKNFGEVTTLGIGNYQAEKLSHISAGQVQYGTLKEVYARKEKLYLDAKSGTDMLSSFATTAISSKIPKVVLEVDIPNLPRGGNLITPAGETVAIAGAGSINIPLDVSKAIGTGGIVKAISSNLPGNSSSNLIENNNSKNKLEEARAKGKQGELDAGINPEVKKTKIESITQTAKRRFPDELDKVKGYLREIKNVKKQSYTNQIKDFNLYAQRESLDFYLEIRPNTKLTKPLLEEVEKGNIIIKYIGE
ncbi:putative toxin [Fusobacterium russii]|uniref:putative toxin n=1 Tax=Fusobacterium russii TaxID=854 RepID=UPI0003A46611|nr:putative toxin [Fusobacterium russii]